MLLCYRPSVTPCEFYLVVTIPFSRYGTFQPLKKNGYFRLNKNALTMITADVMAYIEKSVLCWLATSSKMNEPNVSPKEMFTAVGKEKLLIAHLASPNSVQNIRENENVCVSFVDVFIQKGYKLKGKAIIIERDHPDFAINVKPLLDLFGDAFPIKAVIVVDVIKVELIQAPSYFLFPETTEESQALTAMKTYKVRPE